MFQKLKKWLWTYPKRAIIIGIIVAICLVASGAWLTINQKPTLTGDLIGASFQEESELITVTYRYDDVVVLKNEKEVLGWGIPFTQTQVIVSYSGVIQAGIDLSEVKIVSISDDTITVKLPESHIISNHPDIESVMLLDERNSIFNLLSSQATTDMIKERIPMTTEKAISGGLYELSEQSAERVVGVLIESVVQKYGDYKIKFE